MKALTVTHTLHSIAPEVGGPAVTVPALCEHLGRLGHEVTLRVVEDGGATVGPHVHVERHPPTLGRGRFAPSLSLLHALARDAGERRLLHSHGAWLPTNLAAHLAAELGRVPHVISPRGMLEPYAMDQKRAFKRLALATWQRRALERASVIHVTASSELESVRKLGITAPIAVIPNGVTIPDLPPSARSERRTLLFLGRLDPKKGLDWLIPAWAELAARFTDWDLCIAGPSAPGYRSELQALTARVGAPRIAWLDAQYGPQKSALYARAELFVLPTRSENFGVTVAEALAHGVPAICTRGAPWEGLERERCGRWIELGIGALEVALAELLAKPEAELRSMGSHGRRWVERDFSWPAQAARMAAVYAWLLGEAPRPAWVFEVEAGPSHAG